MRMDSVNGHFCVKGWKDLMCQEALLWVSPCTRTEATSPWSVASAWESLHWHWLLLQQTCHDSHGGCGPTSERSSPVILTPEVFSP